MGCGASSGGAYSLASPSLLTPGTKPPGKELCICKWCEHTVPKATLEWHLDKCMGNRRRLLLKQASSEDIAKITKVQAHTRGMQTRAKVAEEQRKIGSSTKRLSSDTTGGRAGEKSDPKWALMRQHPKLQQEQRKSTGKWDVLAVVKAAVANASEEDVKKVTKVQARTRGVQARTKLSKEKQLRLEKREERRALLGLDEYTASTTAPHQPPVLPQLAVQAAQQPMHAPSGMGCAAAFDTRGDGRADTWAVDTNGDGQADSWAIDTNGDGRADSWGVDTTGDGRVDTAVPMFVASPAHAGATPASGTSTPPWRQVQPSPASFHEWECEHQGGDTQRFGAEKQRWMT